MYFRKGNNYIIRYESLCSPSNGVLNNQSESVKNVYNKLLSVNSSSLDKDLELTKEFIKSIITNVFKSSYDLEYQFNTDLIGMEHSIPITVRGLIVNVVKNLISPISLDMRIRGLVFKNVIIDSRVIIIECS